MAKKYPMTYEEYEKRVCELLFEGMSPEEKKATEMELKELLDEEPDMLRHLYGDACGCYDHDDESPEAYFEDFLLQSRAVSTILMLL